MTALGASIVFFFQGAIHPKLNRAFLGFASGVMMAASVWSLLLPSIAQSQEQGFVAWLPPAAGFAFGEMPGVGTLVSAFGMGPMISYFNVHMSEPLRYGKRNG